MAVPMPAAAVATVADLVDRVRADLEREAGSRRRSEVRWVRTDGLHITLRFLGAADERLVEPVAEATERAAAGRTPFRASVAGTGAFPSAGRPRTLWLGLAEGVEELGGLAARVSSEVAPLGWPDESRPFRPHLTLARADGRREGPRAAELLALHADGLDLRFEIDRVILYESVTGGGPARYVPLHEARLDP